MPSQPPLQLLLMRIGVFHFGVPSLYVRKAMNVLPHQSVPQMKANFGGITLYNRRFISKLYLDSVLGLGLYRPTPDNVSMDATVIFETNGILFCSTVNEVDTIISVPEKEIFAVSDMPKPLPPVFPNADFLLGFVKVRQHETYILDVPKIYQACFVET
ncbi:MAG: chemotaxis protein CheW [Rhizobacter sp.]|nr:chemotaxis protein CheW [Chlorobiales bacterium]